jgi:hypothetical protein
VVLIDAALCGGGAGRIVAPAVNPSAKIAAAVAISPPRPLGCQSCEGQVVRYSHPARFDCIWL